MRIDIGDKIKFSGEEQIFTVLYFNENFVISLNSFDICSIIDLKHDGTFNVEECSKVLKELNIDNEINFKDVIKSKIEKVTKEPKIEEFIDYPAEAFEYKGYYGTDIPLQSNSYYAYLNQ